MDDLVFRALADPNRRTLLDRLFERDGLTLGELEAALPGMTRFGVMKHLRVLEAAGLVTSRKVGRERHHYLNAVPIRQIHDRWLDRYRIRAADLLNDLRTVLEGQTMTTPAIPTTEAPPAQVFVTFIRASAEAIWRAITESEFTVQYYYHSTVASDWRPGSDYEFRIEGQPAIEGTVLESDPPRRLVSTFHATWDHKVASDPASRITWEIDPAGPGVCKLTVVHDGYAARTETYDQVGGGMPFILAGLKTLLETGQPLVVPAGAA